MFTKDNTSKLRHSMPPRSPSMVMPKKKKLQSLFRSDAVSKKKAKSPTKPTYLKKRSVSLPTDLSQKTVKTRKLFWFIPKDHRQRRRPNRQSRQERISPERSLEFNSMRPLMPLSPEISERAVLEWTTTPSAHSLSTQETRDDDDEDNDDALFGLQFIDSVTFDC